MTSARTQTKQLLKKHPSSFIFLPHDSTFRCQLWNISFTNQMQSINPIPPHNPTVLPANLFSLHYKLLNEILLSYHCKLSFLGLKHPKKSRASPITLMLQLPASFWPLHCTGQNMSTAAHCFKLPVLWPAAVDEMQIPERLLGSKEYAHAYDPLGNCSFQHLEKLWLL